MPVIIVGLGNPGNKYAGTRHNIGFELIDRLSASLSVKLGPGKGPFHIGTSLVQNKKIILLKPATFMNRSGDAVQQALHWYKADTGQCLVCYDDLNLPLGILRLRPKGSAGGHNGIKDIVQKLGTDDFPRLRIGIGNDFHDGKQVQFVLSKFNTEDRKLADSTLEKAQKAALCFAQKGIDEAMNAFN